MMELYPKKGSTRSGIAWAPPVSPAGGSWIRRPSVWQVTRRPGGGWTAAGRSGSPAGPLRPGRGIGRGALDSGPPNRAGPSRSGRAESSVAIGSLPDGGRSGHGGSPRRERPRPDRRRSLRLGPVAKPAGGPARPKNKRRPGPDRENELRPRSGSTGRVGGRRAGRSRTGGSPSGPFRDVAQPIPCRRGRSVRTTLCGNLDPELPRCDPSRRFAVVRGGRSHLHQSGSRWFSSTGISIVSSSRN